MTVVPGALDVPEGEIRRFEVGGQDLAVARSDGGFYVFDPVCPHEACDLVEDGEVAGTELTCLCHFSVFDLNTGEVIDGPADTPLKVFETKADDDLELSI